MQRILNGSPASGGIAAGYAAVIKNTAESSSQPYKKGTPDEEKARLETAVEKLAEVLSEQKKELEKSAGRREAEILSAHVGLLHDPYAAAECEKLILQGKAAPEAVNGFWSAYRDMLKGSPDPSFSQRAADCEDIRASLEAVLLGKKDSSLESLPEGCVLVTEELTPSMAARISKRKPAAVAAERGSSTSHAAILLRSMGIPAVFGTGGAEISDGEYIICDGNRGEVIISPDSETKSRYDRLIGEQSEEAELLLSYRDKKPVTKDGTAIEVLANIASPDEAHAAAENGAVGVGLFRTEFLYTGRDSAPGEQEQLEAYRTAALALGGRELIIRTLDIGGDKKVGYLPLPSEENPFLGLRGIRFCLANPEIFKVQLRALLRAGIYGNIKIMLPMICSPDEIKDTKKLIGECAAALKAEGAVYNAEIPVGIMIETPAAVFLCESLAKNADFFSIGTNDLTQYIMASDRGNPAVAYLCDAGSEAVLSAVRRAAAAAKSAGIPCHVCGQAAAEAETLEKLLKCGVRSVSVSPAAVTRVKRTICALSIN